MADGFRSRITVHIDRAQLQRELDFRRNDAQIALDNAVIRDSDPFVPMDTGTLANSAMTASGIGQGRIVYDTPYARRLYYGIDYNFSKLHHPKATAQWTETAKSLYLQRWTEEVRRIFKK